MLTLESKQRVSEVLHENEWSFYLRRKTFHLDDRKRGIRKAMAIQYEKLLFEDPDFVSKIWFRRIFKLMLQPQPMIGLYL